MPLVHRPLFPRRSRVLRDLTARIRDFAGRGTPVRPDGVGVMSQERRMHCREPTATPCSAGDATVGIPGFVDRWEQPKPGFRAGITHVAIDPAAAYAAAVRTAWLTP